MRPRCKNWPLLIGPAAVHSQPSSFICLLFGTSCALDGSGFWENKWVLSMSWVGRVKTMLCTAEAVGHMSSCYNYKLLSLRDWPVSRLHHVHSPLYIVFVCTVNNQHLSYVDNLADKQQNEPNLIMVYLCFEAWWFLVLDSGSMLQLYVWSRPTCSAVVTPVIDKFDA